jgi:hypothetical protein
MHTPPVSAALGSIVIAPPVPFENLVMFPLVLREEVQPGVPSIATLGTHHSDQAEVWADIAEKIAQPRAQSPTGAMEALFQQHASFLDACVAACQLVDR